MQKEKSTNYFHDSIHIVLSVNDNVKVYPSMNKDNNASHVNAEGEKKQWRERI